MIEKIKHILYADRFVSEHERAAEDRNQRGVALIAAAAFAVMSGLNVAQKSYIMLATTGAGAVFLVLGSLISRYRGSGAFLRGVFYTIFVVVFTAYTVEGGNEGFAVLWLIIATYAVMIGIDFKAGFVISLYYFIMLLLTFVGPLGWILQYDYNKTFLLRFPALFAVNFAFATFISIRTRMYQYELLLKQRELEYLNTTDLSTGLMNRNRFIRDEQEFQPHGIRRLCAVFIDVNGLHGVNNREGHEAGDRMLRTVADLCRKQFPNDDIYRMGGDEFLVVCRDKTSQAVFAGAEALYEAVEREGFSISYGVGTQESAFDLNELVKSADARMIAFKSDYYRYREQRNI